MDSRTTHRRSRSRVDRARRRVGFVAVGLVLVLGACSGGAAEVASPFTGSAAQTSDVGGADTGGSTQPNSGADTSDPSVPGSETGSDPSVPGSGGAPTVTAPEGVVTLSADGPWRLVESAPGVDAPGLVYELMPGLWAWLPVEEDLEAGIGWVLTEADVPVIEAYLQAQLVYYAAVTSDPIDLSSPSWDRWYLEGPSAHGESLGAHVEAGDVAEVGAGVVYRPIVLGEARSTTAALVFDCVLDGGYFVGRDGQLAEGSSLGVVETGFEYELRRSSDGWQVSHIAGNPLACER